MSRRGASALAWSLLALYAVLQAVTGWLIWHGPASAVDFAITVPVIGFATVGAMVASRRPENAVGWLLLSIALGLAVGLFAEVYAWTPTHPGRLAAAWFAGWVQNVPLVLAGVFLPLLSPTADCHRSAGDPSCGWVPPDWWRAS